MGGIIERANERQTENLRDTLETHVNAEPGQMRSGSKCANCWSYTEPGLHVSWGREHGSALGRGQALRKRMRRSGY